MKKFTRLWPLMMAMLFISSVAFAQKTSIKSSEAQKAKIEQLKGIVENQVATKSIVAVNADQQDLTQIATKKKMATSVSEKDPKAGAVASPSDYLFDFQFDWPLVNPSSTSVGIETDGNYIYTCHWQHDTIYRYDMDGTMVGWFSLPGVSLIRDLTYDGTYFYGAAAATSVWQMDFTMGAEMLVSTITAPTACRAIGYDDVNGYLFGNNWSTDVNFFDLTGALQSSFVVGPTGASYYGFAFDNYTLGGPYIWGYSQIDVSLEWLIQMTYAGVETGVMYDVGSYLGHTVGNLAGGLAITPPGTFPSVDPTEWSIFGINQNVSMWAIELGEPNPCSTPINLAATEVTSSEYELSWTESGTSTSWEVEWGIGGFTQGTGTTISPATNPQLITGLGVLTSYDFYVRADCGGGSYSAWAGPYSFTTAGDCLWSCVGNDDYGDGWNGGSIDFVVDGNIVANWTGPATTGPETFYFGILDPSTVDIVWNVGSYDSEVTYEIFDNFGVSQFADGPDPVGTTGLAGLCTPPACPSPTDVAVGGATGTEATVSWLDAATAGTYDIVWGDPGFDPDLGPYTGTAYGETYGPFDALEYEMTLLTLNNYYDVYVRADCGSSQSIWVGASFVSAPPPVNDDCADAIYVGPTYPETVTGTTVGATVDCAGVLDWNAVWYEVELPYAENDISISYCGTDMYTGGIVYIPDCASCASYVLADAYAFDPCTSPDPDALQMSWAQVVGPGTIMFPAYAADADANGIPFTLTFDVTEYIPPAPPVNDLCADAIAIGEVVDLAFNTTNATADTYGTCMTSPNIWYNYTATMDGNLVVSLCGSSYDTKLAVYDAFDCATMAEVDCNDDACSLQSELDLGPVTAGTVYKIEVGGYSTNVGEGILNVTVSPFGYMVSGAVTYGADYTPAKPLDAIEISLVDGTSTVIATTMSDASGEFSFVDVVDGTYSYQATTTRPWEIHNIFDVVQTNLYLNSAWTFAPLEIEAADVWVNMVNIFDVVLMNNRLNSLPYAQWDAPDWIFDNPVVTVAGSDVVVDLNTLNAGDVNGSNNPPILAPANDLCSNAEAVAGPYPVTGITGTTMYATNDCPVLMDQASGEVWYAIDLPYALNNVTIDYCGDALMDNGYTLGTTIQCTCVEADYLFGTVNSFVAPCASISWDNVAGPGTFYYAVSTGTYQEDFTMDVDVVEYIPAVGATCSNAFVISDGDLPYVQTGLTTEGFGDDYEYPTDPGMCYYYGNGEDYVFEYTPAADITVDIALTNTDTWTGINVSQGCPDVGTCVGYAGDSGGNPTYSGLTLTGGVTYYIIIGTWPTPDFTAFDISITEVTD